MIRILLVEDEESIAELIKMNLELDNYEVVWVADGKKAINRFKTERYDLIILDVMLPGMSGLDVAEQVRINNPSTPILMLSARSEPTDRIAGLKRVRMIT